MPIYQVETLQQFAPRYLVDAPTLDDAETIALSAVERGYSEWLQTPFAEVVTKITEVSLTDPEILAKHQEYHRYLTLDECVIRLESDPHAPTDDDDDHEWWTLMDDDSTWDWPEESEEGEPEQLRLPFETP